MADYPLPTLPAQFDPSKPFTQVPEVSAPVKSIPAPVAATASTPQFDPGQPFEIVPDAPATPAAQFNPNESFSKVFTPVDIATKTKDELAADKEFNPTDFFANNPDVARDPAQLQKVLDAYRARRVEGIKLGETAATAAKSALPTAGKFAKGIYQQASNLFVLTGLQDLANDILGTVTGQTPQVKQELMKEGLRAGTEAQAKSVAATETSATGLADLARTGARKLFGKSPEKLTDQELLQELSADAAFQTKLRETAEGRGEFLKGVGLDADELAKQGIALDPRAIENMSLVDPLTLVALGGAGKVGFQLVGKAGKVIATVPTVEAGVQLAAKLGNAVKPALESVSTAARKAVGIPTELLGKGITFASPAAPAIGGAVGIAKGGPFGLISGVYAGERLATGLAKTGEVVQSLGQQISGRAPLSPALQNIVSGTKLAASLAAAPAKGAAIGTAIALPLAAAAEGSEQAGAILGGGLGLGAIGGVVHGTAHAASELAAKTFFDPHSVKFEPVASPDYGVDAVLDGAHRANLGKRSVNEQGDVTTAREIFRPLGGEIYSVDKTTFANQIIGQLTERLGRTPTPEEIAGVQGKIDAQGYFDFERPDGRKVVLLNADSAALWHESGHLTYALLPDGTKAALMDSVRTNYSPEQLSQLKAQYEARLGSQISEAKFLDELVAENFNAVFNNVPVTQLKAPAGFLRSLGSVLAQVGETLGADLTRGRTSPDLNVPLTQRLRAQFDKAARELLASAPETPAQAAPTPPSTPTAPSGPAPTATQAPPAAPARNIRVTKAQQDALAERAAVTGVTEAKSLAAKDADPTVAERVNTISAQMEAGNPVLEIEHLGIADTGTPAAPTGRTPRRGKQAAGYAELERLRVENRANAPADIVNLHQKTFVPVRWTEQGGTPTLIAMSADKVISNLNQIARLASEKGAESLLPYEVVNGKLTDAAWRKALADVQAYAENQANGFRGDGQRLARPAEGELSIPAENKDYVPTQLSPEVANFANLVQGLATPETAREITGKIPGNIKGQILAEANKRQLLEVAGVKPKNRGKQEFKSFPGRSLKEVNPLRNELAERGVHVRELLDVTERVRAKDIASVKPRTDLDFKAPVTDVIRGGFLPKEQTVEQINEDLRPLDIPAFKAKIKEWGKSLTLKAFEVGENVKSRADVDSLRKFAAEQAAISKEDLARGDFDAAGSSALKSQFFREAFEAATGEGGSVGFIRKYTNPNYKPPFPSEGVEFLPRRKIPELPEQLPDYLNTPEQGRINALSSDLVRARGTTPQFWLNSETGKVLLAPEGHVAAARDLADMPSGADAPSIYEIMEDRGWLRGVNERVGNAIYLNGSADLSRAARQTAEDIAFRAGKEVSYAGKTVVERPTIPEEPEFLPARRSKSDRILEAQAREKAERRRAEIEMTDFSKYESAPKASPSGKMSGWILPNRKFVGLESDRHERYLADNSESLNKEFGTKFSSTPDLEERGAALNKGFIRIRENRGKLDIEVNSKFLSGENRRNIEKFLSDNADNIDRLTISALDNSGNVVDTVSRNVVESEGAARVGELIDAVSELRGKRVSGREAFLPGEKGDERTQQEVAKRAIDILKPVRERLISTVGPSHEMTASVEQVITQFQKAEQPKSPYGLFEAKSELAHAQLIARRQTQPIPVLKSVKDVFGQVFDLLEVPMPEAGGPVSGLSLVGQGKLAPEEGASLRRAIEQRFGFNYQDASYIVQKLFQETGSVPSSEISEASPRAKITPRLEAALKSFSKANLDANEIRLFMQGATLGQLGKRGEGAYLPVKDMTPKEQKAVIKEIQDEAEIKFPEAKIPQFVYNDDGSPKIVYGGVLGRQLEVYNFADTKLAKQAAAGKEGKAATQAAVTALGDKLAEYYNSTKDNPEIAAGVTWYSLARKKLVELFGDDAKFFAELLGATSPQTDVKQNFKYALDAYNRFKAGAFDDILKKYREGKQKWATGDIADYLEDTGKKTSGPKAKQATRGHFLNWWIEKNELVPYRSEKTPEGKPLRYGMHSKPLLRVLDGTWLEEVVGPKTPNFMGNLTGDTFEATIDIWAARALHRMGAEQPGKRWRILPESETGVQDADFEFGQRAFRHAADKVGIQPDALQAILWFAEKEKYEREGWTTGAGKEKSDFNTFLAKTEKTGPGQFRLQEEPKIQKRKVAVSGPRGEIVSAKKVTKNP